MKPWLKLGSVVVTLALLAACSSGIEQPDLELGDETPELSTQGTSVSNVVPNSASDAEENAAGEAYTTSTVLELGYRTDGTPQTTGVRFLGVAVPKGARVTSAFIRFTADTDKSEASNLTIAGQDVASAGPFSGTTNNITSRTKTSAKATWQPGSWLDGQFYNSSSITGVVQELVNRSDWQQGAAMVFIISGTGIRKAVSYDQSSTLAPKLYVTYETVPTTNPEIATWQSRLEAQLNSTSLPADYDLKKKAATGDLYMLGRRVNNGLTSLIAAYRVNRDPDTARYIKAVMDIAYSKLRDTNGDGYKNWLYLTDTDASSRPYLNTDKHVMDEMLTHSMVAAAAYTLKEAGYTTSANDWTNYLKNDFEAKWRKRNNKPTGFPFIKKDLFHAYVQFARYNYYMYKLTGQSAYYSEAKRITTNSTTHMRPTSDGGYVWGHHIVEGRQSASTDCQTTTYLKYTLQAMQDLAMVDSSLFSSAFMSKVATTINKRVIGSGDGTPLRDNVCGAGTETNTNAFVNYPYAAVAPWDSSGNIESKLKAYYKAGSNSGHYNIPAMMILSLGR